MNKLKKTALLLCLLVIVLAAPAQKVVRKYIQKYDSIAIEKSQKHKIPVSIILGVSIVESSAGRSIICKYLNNFFGIKGKNWSSEEKMGYKSAYKQYKTDAESFEHFCQVLINKNFYKKLKGTTNYKEWLNEMNKASYASAKQKWIDDITRTIKLFELWKFDAPDETTASTAVQ